jgi:NAD(P)H-quinone oxidoreductase subunit 6
MENLIPLVRGALYVVMAVSLIAAIGVVRLPNLFHAALCLVGVLVGTAAIYIALKADFLAAVQILLYVGAVMTLVIFAIMLTSRLSEKSIHTHNKLSVPGSLAGIALFVCLASAIMKTPWRIYSQTSVPDTLALGAAMMGRYIFPFEVVSVVLIAVLIGALVIAKKDKAE